jgi:Fungal specific transcription factor domain
MACAVLAGFSWVNFTPTSVIERDEEAKSIIKSHAMRVYHHQHPRPRRKQTTLSKPRNRRISPKETSSNLPVSHDDVYMYKPETDWEGLAIYNFMETFVYPVQASPENAFQYLNFLPGLYNKYSDRSCLTEAISAVAVALLANQTRNTNLSLRARKTYVNALTLVNDSLKDPLSRDSDHVLAALCLLTKYEIVGNNRDPDKESLWQTHEKGQTALICQRGANQLKTEIGASLFRLIYIRQQLNCISKCEEPAIRLTSSSWELAFPMPRLRKLMELIARIANIRFATAAPLSPREACRVAEDAAKIDADMTAFIENLPPNLQYHSVPNATHSADAPPIIHIFHDLQHASLWHVFWYGRIYLLQTLLQYSAYQPEILRSRLHETVGDICASVLLNDADCPQIFVADRGGRAIAAHYLIWVLAAASTVPDLPESRREWISGRLRRIGVVYGIRQALVFA